MKHFLLFIILSFLVVVVPIKAFSQRVSYNERIEIYNENNLKVDIEFKIYNTPCTGNGRNHQFNYYLQGDLPNSNKYLTWKMDIENCSGGAKTIVRSVPIGPGVESKIGLKFGKMDWVFNSKPFTPKIYDVKITNSDQQDDIPIINTTNIIADRIGGLDEIIYGEKVQLNVIGGELGVGGEWMWYENECGGKVIGNGENITLNLNKTKIIYLGIEGGNNNVNCISKKINVNTESKNPSKILGPEFICKGLQANLSIQDGFLGPNSKWEWFEQKCGGKKIGEGESITVYPTSDTKYFVKAVGANGTDYCTEIIVSVIEKQSSELPREVKIPDEICEGEKITLTNNNATFNLGSEWIWYFTANGVDKTKVGVGASLDVYPEKTGFYILTEEGVCGPTNEFKSSNKIIVLNKMNYYSTIEIKPVYPKKGDKVAVNLTYPLNETKWLWTKDEKSLKTTEDHFDFKLKKSTQITVIDRNKCSTKTLTKYISPRPDVKSGGKKSFTLWYSKKVVNNKTIHIGFSGGIFTKYKAYPIDVAPADLSYMSLSGVDFQISFHPIIKNNFSLGFYSNYKYGLTSVSFLNGEDFEDGADIYSSMLSFGTELAFGFNKFKLLAKYEVGFDDVEFRYSNDITGIDNRRTYVQSLDEEVKVGFRLLPYTNKQHKKSHTIDLTFNFYSNPYSSNFNDYSGFNKLEKIFDFSDNSFRNINYGAEIEYWMQSGIKANFKYINESSNYRQRNIFQASILWNINLFY